MPPPGGQSEEQHAVIDTATSPDTTLVAAVSGRRIRVVGFFLVASGAVAARFESGTGGAALTGAMSMAANGQISPQYNPLGLFTTAAGALLNLELGVAVQVSGALTYVLTD